MGRRHQGAHRNYTRALAESLVRYDDRREFSLFLVLIGVVQAGRGEGSRGHLIRTYAAEPPHGAAELPDSGQDALAADPHRFNAFRRFQADLPGRSRAR